MDVNIFKSYDIRGIYPGELNKETAFKIGQAFVNYSKAKNIVVGWDARLSSPALFESLTEGITSQGADVYNIGQVPTEAVYFASAHFDYDAGIMITASHNPKEYNGFKMIRRKSKGMFEIVRGKDLAELAAGNFKDKEVFGEVKELNIWENYINHVFSFVDLGKMNPLKIVIDASNGMAGKVISLIKDKILAEIIILNSNLDGNFPAHPPNPLLEESAEQIKEKIKEEKADFGAIFDGDGDRVFLIDENGKMIRGDIALLFLAKHFLKKFPGQAVAYNLICSKAVPEFIKKMGGKPVKSKVGYVNVSKALIENNGVVSGEISGHYSFKDNYYFDSGIIAFLVLLQVVSSSGKKVSEIAKEYSVYEISAEINFKVKDKEAIIEKAKEKYADGKQNFLDGLTVEYEEWWFNLRPSNTEPLLRLTVEGNTKKLLEEKKKELTSFISSISPAYRKAY